MTIDISFLMLALLGIWGITWIIQLFYYLFFYIRISKSNKSKSNVKLPPVSVIVCARNEEENLQRFLPKVLTQDYPNYEVIVVNDASEDNSDVVLKQLSEQYPHLKISTIKKERKIFAQQKTSCNHRYQSSTTRNTPFYRCRLLSRKQSVDTFDGIVVQRKNRNCFRLWRVRGFKKFAQQAYPLRYHVYSNPIHDFCLSQNAIHGCWSKPVVQKNTFF